MMDAATGLQLLLAGLQLLLAGVVIGLVIGPMAFDMGYRSKEPQGEENE